MNLLLFDILTIALIVIDIRNYGKHITPLTIVGGVYVCLINLNNLVISNIYNFIPVNDQALWTIFGLLAMVFCVDFCGGLLYRGVLQLDFPSIARCPKHRSNVPNKLRHINYRSVVILLFLIGVAAYMLQFVTLCVRYGLLSIKGQNNGILGHLCLFAFVLGPVVLDISIKVKKKQWLMIAALLNIIVVAISVAFGGKYVIFINSTYFLLYFILKKGRKVTALNLLKIMLILIGGAVGVFTIIYYVIPRATGQYQSSIGFVVEHMFYYLLSPIVANNYTMTHAGQGDASIPFTIIINIVKALIRDHNYVSPIYPLVFPVDGLTNTNVSGFMGETIYNLGIIGTFIYVAFIFAIINFFHYQYRKKNKFYLSYCYSTAIVMFLFFCNFFTVSGVVFPLLLAVLLDILLFNRCREKF